MTFPPHDWGMLRRSRCVQIFFKQNQPSTTDSKHHIQPAYGERAGWRGAGRLNSHRETEFSGAYGDMGILIFPVQLTTSRIGNLTQLIHTLLYMMTIDTYILLLLFLTFSALVANPKKLLYTVANPARGLLNREKKKKKKSGSAPPPPRARCPFGEIYLVHTIGSVPRSSGHSIAYRWLSLTRVFRHRTSTPSR